DQPVDSGSNQVKDYPLDAWLKSYVQSEQVEIETKAVAMLIELLGNELSRMINQIGKIKIVIKDRRRITADLEEEDLGLRKDYDNFEVINDLAYKNDAKAFDIAKYFALNTKNNPLVVSIAVLYNFFSKLLQYHGIMYKNSGANQTDVAKQLGINPYGLKDYQAAFKLYPMKKVSANIEAIREIDVKGKGVEGNLTHDDLLKELLIKILR